MFSKVVLLCVYGMLALGAEGKKVCCSPVQPAYSVQSAGLYGNGGCGYQGNDALSIAVGSSYAPTGIRVVAENLEACGPVSVNGAYPILGAVSFGGNLQTGGQGQVSYSTASGVGLGSAGCGYGLPTSQPDIDVPQYSGCGCCY